MIIKLILGWDDLKYEVSGVLVDECIAGSVGNITAELHLGTPTTRHM